MRAHEFELTRIRHPGRTYPAQVQEVASRSLT